MQPSATIQTHLRAAREDYTGRGLVISLRSAFAEHQIEWLSLESWPAQRSKSIDRWFY